MMKNYLPVVSAILMIACTCCATQTKTISNASLNKIINQNFKDADAQYKVMMKQLPAERFPKTFEQDSIETSN